MTAKTGVRSPRQARSKATVEAILEAAAQVLRSEGLEGCTTSKIAKRAGVGVGSLYQYFGNKEAIYDALIDRLLAERLRRRSETLRRPTETEELGPEIMKMVDALVTLHLTDPELQHQLHRYEAAAGFGRLEEHTEQMMSVAVEVIRRYQHLFRPIDPELAARIAVLAMTGVGERLARQDPEALGAPAVRREMAALLAGYLSPLNPIVGLDLP